MRLKEFCIFGRFFETAKVTLFRFYQYLIPYKMQNTFEQVNELIDNLEIICKNHSLPLIEKDIVLERLRKIYMTVQNRSVSESSIPSVPTEKYEVYQGIQDDVDLFFDTDHESYGKQLDLQEQEEELEREIEEEGRKKAEEAARLQAEQMRRQAEEEQRRREEEARLKAAEEQRKAEELRRQAEEEQRKREEEARQKALEEQRLAEERRRQAEEEQRRREEEARLKAAEEQRKAEERRRQAEEEQKKREEEARLKAAEEQRLAEERRRQAEAEQRKREEESRQKATDAAAQSNAAVQDEDDLLQFLPKNNSSVNVAKPLSGVTPQRSLNDLFTAQREDHTLSAQFQNAKVSDLTKAISINDKFTFIKELFHNKGEEFSASITKLNNCATMDDAVNCLEELKQKFFWDSASTAYLSLCDLVRRKYN